MGAPTRTKELALNKTQLRIGTAFFAGALLFCGPGVVGDAAATLGGDGASIKLNQQHLGAAHKVEVLAAGERHELRLPSGTVVQQYLSPKGTVYAVSWHGQRPPNLQELLGSYFPQLSTRNPGRRRTGHHQLNVSGEDLMVQSSGHNRSFSGRAWVPSLVPAGVDVATLVEVGQ
jgi:hypothetical protein